MSPHENLPMTRRMTRFIREGEYAAEVVVEIIDAEGGWAPYLTVAEAFKIDDIREALRSGDLDRASRLGRVFRLTPVAV
jgi:hypothetical protein